MEPTQFYLNTPSITQTQIYEVPIGQKAIVRELILSNTAAAEAKLTVTVNTVDVIKDYPVPAGKTEILNVRMVLKQNDKLFLQQDTTSAINVMINGLLD